MTTIPLDSPASPGAQVVVPEPETRLAQLLAQYDLAKAESDKAAETLKAITDAVKAELVQQAPGANDIRVESEHLARPLRLLAVTSWRVDARKLKEEAPEVYVRYAKQSTAWTLRGITS